MKILNLTKLILTLIVLSVFVSGQEKKDASADRQVLLNASVYNSEGKIIKDLKKENFQLYENDKPVEISYFSNENFPISVGILIDVSRSMGEGVDISREGILSFIEKSNLENEYFTVVFSRNINLVSDFTNADKISKIISESPYFTKTPKPGELALYDAIKFGMENLSKAKNQRKVLFVFWNARKDYSPGNYKEIEKLVREKNITVYPVYCGLGSDVYSNDLAEPELAEISGGKTIFYEGGQSIDYQSRFYSPKEYFNLQFSKLADRLQNPYVVGFKPNLEGKDNKWRKLEIKLELPKELRKQTGKTFVLHRTGYYPSSNMVTGN